MFQFGYRRPSTGFGARLAIMAIALQLVLSFGHIHPLPYAGTVASTPGDSAPDMPAAGDDCAICANIAAFAALDLPGRTFIPLPTAKAVVLASDSVARAVDLTPIRHFSSRAPPAA